MFWICIVLAIIVGGVTLLDMTVGIGLQFVGLILAGNAYTRLARGKPPKTKSTMSVMWIAAVISVFGSCVGLYRLV